MTEIVKGIEIVNISYRDDVHRGGRMIPYNEWLRCFRVRGPKDLVEIHADVRSQLIWLYVHGGTNRFVQYNPWKEGKTWAKVDTSGKLTIDFDAMQTNFALWDPGVKWAIGKVKTSNAKIIKKWRETFRAKCRNQMNRY